MTKASVRFVPTIGLVINAPTNKPITPSSLNNSTETKRTPAGINTKLTNWLCSRNEKIKILSLKKNSHAMATPPTHSNEFLALLKNKFIGDKAQRY
jgi:hypothetical protein